MSKKTLHYHGTNTGNYDWVWRDMDGLVIVGNHLHHDRRTDGRTRENLFFWWSDSEIIEERLVLSWVSSWKSSKSQCPPPPCPVLRLPRSYKPIESVIDSFWQIRFTARCWSAFCIWRCAPWIVVDGVEPDRLAGTHKWDNGKVRKKKKSHLFAEWLLVTICWENPMQRHKEQEEFCFGGPTQQTGTSTSSHCSFSRNWIVDGCFL